MTSPAIAIIGGGPGGLMAAQILSGAMPSAQITVYERKPSFARKFLMAGRGGLNLTHSENINDFLSRYGAESQWLKPFIDNFTPQQLREWAYSLGEETFIGTSGRVFPKAFKASPLLRAWQKKLEQAGVILKTNYDWHGWNTDGDLIFNTGLHVKADVVLLALGGASWPRLGSDGGWVNILKNQNIDISPLRPANSGFMIEWPDYFSAKFAGTPLKPVTITCGEHTVKGEAMITAQGIEGGAIYALSRTIRETCEKQGYADIILDLKSDVTEPQMAAKLSSPRGSLSWSNYLRKTINLPPMAIALLRTTQIDGLSDLGLAKRIKNLPLRITGTAGIDRAISSAGGIKLDQLDNRLMLKNKPGVFACGEMLDWEAPTGGYLLQATFSTAVAAAKGMLDCITKKP